MTTKVQSEMLDLSTYSGALGPAFAAGAGSNTLSNTDPASVSTPTSGLTLFSDSTTGFPLLAFKDSLGVTKRIGGDLFSKQIGLIASPGYSQAIHSVGLYPSFFGTQTSRTPSNTSKAKALRRHGYTSTTAANTQCGIYPSYASCFLGMGILYSATFMPSPVSLISTLRYFVGLDAGINSAIPSATSPNVIGIGIDTGGSNLVIFYGGSVAQTPIDLGANFPGNTQSVDAYRFTLYFNPNDSTSIRYAVERIGTPYAVTGVLTGEVGTSLPALATPLGVKAMAINGANGGQAGIDVATMYLETGF